MGLGDVTDALWFLTDVTFLLGFGMAMNVDAVQDFVKDKLKYGLYGLLTKGKVMPQHMKKFLDNDIPKWTYNCIYYLMYFAMAWNMTNTVFGEPRHWFFNLVYLVYPYLIAEIAAKEILLDDEKKEWKVHIKRRHVIFPLNLEGSKKNAQRMDRTRAEHELVKSYDSLRKNLPRFMGYLALSVIYYFIAQDGLRWISGFGFPLIFKTQIAFNAMMADVQDIFTITLLRDKFDPTFLNPYEVIENNDCKHDVFGRHYRYFESFFTPIEKLVMKKGYLRAKNKFKFSKNESVAFSYLCRGAAVITFLVTTNLVHKNHVCTFDSEVLQKMSGLMPYVLYYAIHAFFAYFDVNKRLPRKSPYTNYFDKKWVRYIVGAGEVATAGLLWYEPLYDSILAPSFVEAN